MRNDIPGMRGDAISYEAALALQMNGRVQEAEQMYEAFLQRCPDHAEALHALGVIRLQSGRVDLAITHLQAAVSAGGSAVVRSNLGVALCSAQRFAEAADVYRSIVKDDPKAVSSHANLGQILNQLLEFAEAAEVLKRAVELAPGNARIHNQLAVALAETARFAEAEPHYQRAITLEPRRIEYYYDYGEQLLKQDRAAQAVDCFRRALAVAPSSPLLLVGMGEALGHLTRHAEAVACFQRAIALAPSFAAAHYNLGTALVYLGRMEEAETAYNRAVELDPENPTYRGALIAMAKDTATRAQLTALEKMAASGDHLGPQEQMEIQFTLARAYEDCGEYAQAMAALQKGNGAKRRINPYDLQHDLDRFAVLAEVFSQQFLAEHAGVGHPADFPVFVVGMPRSGTTLVEQILASHPRIYGAGELAILPDLINAGAFGGNFPETAPALTADAWRSVGQAYARALRSKAPDALRLVDKLPLNFQLIGLIRTALPHARIIHVMRDPLDTCLSCYFTLFANGLGFADDLSDLGRYYRGYLKLMQHWQAVLPETAILQIRYEDLVANYEVEARRLVDYCGLAWDSRCMDFHKTVRPVETASTLQVRRPLYQTSVGRAEYYREWLGPLIEALGDTNIG